MKIFLYSVLVLVICTSAVLADIIYLKSGGQLEGEIAEETDEHIIIRMKMGGTTKIIKDRIASIEGGF